MYKITKEFHFCAAHKIQGLAEGHPCSRLHGHNYIVKVELRKETLDSIGFIKDYGELKPIKEWIDRALDHRYLNEILIINPTAENIAEYLFHKFKPQFPDLFAIEISETPKTNARYEFKNPKYEG